MTTTETLLETVQSTLEHAVESVNETFGSAMKGLTDLVAVDDETDTPMHDDKHIHNDDEDTEIAEEDESDAEETDEPSESV